MMEATKPGDRTIEKLDDMLPMIHRLTTHDKLILIRILADELASESNLMELYRRGPTNSILRTRYRGLQMR